MKKIIVGVVVLALIGGGAFVVLGKDDKNGLSSNTSTATNSDSSTDEASSASSSNGSQPVATSAVTIADMAFGPTVITVKKGTTVTWTNNDSVQHNVAPDTETGEFKAGELLSKGESYEVTFNTVGTFTYHCTPHPFMKGTVLVTD